VTDQRPDADEAVADIDAGDIESGPPDPDDQDAYLAPTRSTRTRPNALDLARAFD
jgi:hypothetical protein